MYGPTVAWAVDWHGYGSVRLGQFSTDGQPSSIPEFYRDTNKLSFSEETLFGIQMQHDLSDDWQLVAQWQARGNRDFKPETRLLFLRWQLNEQWQLKVGRLDIPLFAQSDTQYIGYAHDFSRLPKSVYYRFHFETGEGVSLEHQYNGAEITLKSQLQWTHFEGPLYKSSGTGIEGKLRNIQSARFNLDAEQWNLVAGGMQTSVQLDALDALFARQLAPTFAQLNIASIDQQNFLADTSFTKDGAYWYVGAKYHPGNWKFEVERSSYGVKDTFDGFTDSWFAAVSYRFDDLVMTLHHEDLDKRHPDLHQVLRESTPTELFAVVPTMVKALNQRTMQLNVLSARYDVAPNVALKGDYFRGSVTVFYNGMVQDAEGFSLGVDFVF